MTAEVSIEPIIAEEQLAPPHLRLVPDLVRLVPEMPGDAEARLQAAQLAGAALTSHEVELELVTAEKTLPIHSLYEAAQRAYYDNDHTARRMIGANAGTNMVEMINKAGVGKDIELQFDEDFRIWQWDQPLETIQANSTRRIQEGSPQMRGRTTAEGNNVFRLQHALQQGELEDNYFVVITRAPDDMSVEQADKEGFFVDTMSFGIQATTLKNDKLVTEVAFVAGVTEPNGERHDNKMIAGLGEQLEIDIARLTATQLLDTPLLINKRLMQDGVINLVAVCDEMTGTFFGQAHPRQDYAAFREQSFAHEDMLAKKREAIVDELINEAPTLQGPLHATERLHKITEKHMVQQAMFDTRIDPTVFGAAAAPHIEQGRLAFEQGLVEEGLSHTMQAEKLSDAKGCPSGLLNGQGKKTSEQNDGTSKEGSGDCDFISKECPKCHAKNVRTVVSKGWIKGDCGCKAKLK